MQIKSTLSRFVAFALFMLSFSMLVCAAPAPAPAALAVAGPGELGNSLVARGDVSDQCYNALVDLKAKISVQVDTLNKCYSTPGCDCKPIVASIVILIKACIDIIVKLSGTIDLKIDLIVKVFVEICVILATACSKWVVKLGLAVYLKIFVDIDVALCALLNALIVLSASIKVKVKVLLILQLQLLVTACFNGLIKLCGL